ncbi:MAG: nucleoside deaminase [Bacilli bacterium]|nr:nucleoside deaminase [Bacilli bacterium]
MNKKYMDLAFEYAEKAFELDEVPVGAVIVKDNEVISYGFNSKEKNCCVMAHAEIIAIKKAEEILGNWRLDNCDMYVTLDPCPMCASAIKQSRIKNVYSALNNSDTNNSMILEKIFSTDSVNSSVNFITNCETKYSQELLKKFFEKQRNK